ncbi:non-ribosomal peptide synthetase [Herbidospora mongoliensis]|uniref:non-ribosomal peptide synthetase n=1 Tax=Herbidospora mongoliensis TaxID=688067 RepID=UPI0008345112|nr:non-ribosomal peptide synthetase [Herbidospora mongoliensis]
MTSVVAVPASYAQERLWLAERLAGGRAHHVHTAVELTGPLDVTAFAAAVQRAAGRHEALRTTLRPIDGRPHQLIADHLVLPSPVGETASEVRLDLASGPVVHSELVRVGPDRHVWLLTAHHAVCDGWSLGVLLEEIGAAYRGEPLAEPALHYADYAIWQRDLGENGGLDEGLAHWSRVLAGAPAALDLPADRTRPTDRTLSGALLPLPPLPAGLATLAETERVTPFAAALAAFALLLHRLTGAGDLVIGTTHAGRDRPETERLVGCVANTLPLRIAVDPRMGFRALLHRAGDAVLSAHDHADVPFDRIVHTLNPAREPGRHPIFQVMLDTEPPSTDRLRLPGVTAKALPAPDRGVALFDLSLTLSRDGGVVLEYSTDLFDEETAHSYASCLAPLTASALSTPDAPLRDLPALPETDRNHLIATSTRTIPDITLGDMPALAEEDPQHPPATRVSQSSPIGQVAEPAGAANRSHRAADHSSLVQDLIEAAARRRPDAYAAGELTWREFMGRASWVQQELERRGVGRGAVVALLAERSPEAIAWICGIHRAGAAYLPLDPALPEARLTDLLSRIRPAAVITGDATRLMDFPTLPEVRTAAVSVAVAVSSQDLAYVMFTSGSTGEPKAVEVTHGGLAAYVAAHQALYDLSPDDRVLQSGSLSFDLSAEEIFPCLVAGATLVPRTEDMLEGPDAFLAGLDRLGITVAHLPTSLLPPLDGPPPAALRLVVVGSEPADPARLRPWAAVPGARLVHVYGVTEASMVSTAAFLDEVPERTRPSIGHAIAGTEVHVLDAMLEPAPDGVPGEVYIGGAGLARGYRGDPRRTASRFVPHPFAQGRRLYRTGDLARRRADGSLEHLGRRDRQLSLRGFRIDPLEPEAALRRHPAVADAAVTVRGDLLAGYVVPRGESVPAHDLRAHVAESLPPHLVPGVFVWLEALPRTGSGKVDVAALPAPPARTQAARPLTGPAQIAVADVWRAVLGVDGVGPDDDFFQLGGHSLLAGQVAARLRRHFGVPVPMTLIFRHPRLADLAAAVEQVSHPGTRPFGGRGMSAGQALRDAVGDSDELAELMRNLGVGRD